MADNVGKERGEDELRAFEGKDNIAFALLD
jgi:hypothetical protein